MSETFDLVPAAQAVIRTVTNVSDDQLDSPTPCPDYDVRDMLFHVLGLSQAFRSAADKDLGEATSTPPGTVTTNLPDTWRDELPLRLTALADAWRRPEAWEGMTQAGGVGLPADIAARVALNELTMHGWDIARSTGQGFSVPDDLLQVSYDFLWPGTDQSKRDPIFGPVVPVPEDAPLLDKVIGLGGRDPRWTP